MWSQITPREAFQIKGLQIKIQAAKAHDTCAEAHIHLETSEINDCPKVAEENEGRGGVHGQAAPRACPLLLPQHILCPLHTCSSTHHPSPCMFTHSNVLLPYLSLAL